MKRPKVGTIIEVEWLDSGIGDRAEEGKGAVTLHFNKTYGRVTSLSRCDSTCKKLCRGKVHRCAVLEVAMDSAGKGDSQADLAVIWWEAVVNWRKLA